MSWGEVRISRLGLWHLVTRNYQTLNPKPEAVKKKKKNRSHDSFVRPLQELSECTFTPMAPSKAPQSQCLLKGSWDLVTRVAIYV